MHVFETTRRHRQAIIIENLRQSTHFRVDLVACHHAVRACQHSCPNFPERLGQKTTVSNNALIFEVRVGRNADQHVDVVRRRRWFLRGCLLGEKEIDMELIRESHELIIRHLIDGFLSYLLFEKLLRLLADE